MASLQTINRRIRSVKNTRQITKAMQLVAASKLRRAQTAALGPQAYTEAARELLANLSGQPVVKRHPLMTERPVKHELSILIAGDRGMAGGYNSNVVRALGRHVRETPAIEHSAIAIGRRAAMHLARAKDVHELATFDIEAGDADTAIAIPVLDQVARLFESGEIDAVQLITTDFVSTVTQKVEVRQLLPVIVPDKTTKGDAEMEPEAEDLVDFAIRRVLEAELVQAILEARASEQAARMLAMMNATDNADDFISDLTLVYNNERQSGITQEISEITAGAEAITKA